MTAVVAPPIVTPRRTGPHGFAVIEQPIDVVAPSPTLDGGRPLVSQIAPSGKYVVDAQASSSTFSYGLVLCRSTGPGSADVWSAGSWHPTGTFDFGSPALSPAPLALDATSGTWATVVVLSTEDAAKQPMFPTDPTTTWPRYGFLSLLRMPSAAPAAVAHSPASPLWGVGSELGGRPAAVEARHDLAPTTDPDLANGVALVARDGSGALAAEVFVTTMVTEPGLLLRVLQSGADASVALERNGDVTVSSAGTITIDAPSVAVTGDVYAQSIQYQPHGGGSRAWL